MVHVLTKDFVVPQMALEEIGAMEGWRRFWPMMKAEKGGYAGYVGMKIVLAIGAGIVIGIASVILVLVLAIPTVGVAIVAVLTGKSVRADVECLYDHARGSGGMRSIRDVHVFDCADFSAGHCILSGVFDLFFCGAVSAVEFGAVSAAAVGSGVRWWVTAHSCRLRLRPALPDWTGWASLRQFGGSRPAV